MIVKKILKLKGNEKGITLSALVITIGVLIVLAGITLGSLKGENSIIARSKTAKQQAEKAGIAEKIQSEMQNEEAKKGNGEKLTESEIDNILKNFGTVKGSGNDKTLTTDEGYVIKVSDLLSSYNTINLTGIEADNVTVAKGKKSKINIKKEATIANEELAYISANSNIATVSEDGIVTGVALGSTTITITGKNSNISTTCTVTVKKATTTVSAAQIAEKPEKYYGKIAENYTKGGLTYRIFYVDKDNKYGDGKNTVYLKADYQSTMKLENYISYNSKGNDLLTYKRMNPSWTAKRGGIDATSWNNNEKAAAWLCAPSQWTAYVDEEKASYAIGGPSVEMYVDSYNQVPHTEVGNYTLEAKYSETTTPGYIYTLNGIKSTISNDDYFTGTDSIDYKEYGSMYAGTQGNKDGYWWMASPSSYNTYAICYVTGFGACLHYNGYNNSVGIGPLVTIKPAIRIEIEE